MNLNNKKRDLFALQWTDIAAKAFPELDTTRRTSRTLLVLVAGLGLGLLSGCGGAWQPDPRDAPQSPARSGVEGSGIIGPEESRTNI